MTWLDLLYLFLLAWIFLILPIAVVVILFAGRNR